MRYEKDSGFPFVFQKEPLKIGIPEKRHGSCEIVFQRGIEVVCEGCDIALRQESGKILSSVSVHFLFDTKQALGEAPDVVVTISVCPDILDDLVEGSGWRNRLFFSDRRGLAEILEKSAIEAIEHHEMRFVRKLLPLAGAASEHLFKEDT